MLLSTLPYGFDAGRLIPGLVLRADSLGRAVYDDVDLPEQVVERAGDGNAGRLHLRALVRDRRVDGIAPLHRDFDAVVVDNVGHADELHIVLECHRVGYALADHSVAIHSHASLLHCHHVPPALPCL